MSKQDRELTDAMKGFITMDGELGEYAPWMFNSDLALCLDFIDYLKAADWLVASPRIRDRLVKWIFRTNPTKESV